MILAGLAGWGGPSTTMPPRSAPSLRPAVGRLPRRRAPTKAEDAAALKQVVVTAADLGKPWVRPDKVPWPARPQSLSRKAERPRAGRHGASSGRNLTEGKGQGVNIGTFRLSTLPSEDATQLRAAYAKDNATCKTFTDANKLFVVYSEEGRRRRTTPTRS